MPIVNDTNFVNKIPTANDYGPWIQDSDGVAYTATMRQYAEVFQSLASLIDTVTVYSTNQTLTDEQFVEVNSGAAVNITLPASSLNTGRAYKIFNKGAGAVSVIPNGGDTINGSAVLILSQYQTVIVQSDGLGMWAVFGGDGVLEAAVPASSTSSGVAGQVAYDSSYLYVCVATDTWTRVPISEWS